MFYADTVGLGEVLARILRYRETFGDYWQPAPLLARLAASGGSFYIWSADGRRASAP